MIDLNQPANDYRDFSQDEKQLLANRIYDPILNIQTSEDGYCVRLGLLKGPAFKQRFIATESLDHNWAWDVGKVLALTNDAPEVAKDILDGCDPNKLSFSEVVALKRKTDSQIRILIDESVLDKANSKALSLSTQPPPKGLQANLFPYQRQGVAWMVQTLHSTGGLILADEMGLGKTIQIIALLLLERPSNEHPALVVCPTTLITNWCREIERFAPSLSYLVHRGSDRTGFYKDLMRSNVVITTYDTLVNDISAIRGVTWGYLICDEAQAVKNPSSKRRKTIGTVRRKYTIPVTGTPVETSLMDLWSLSDLAIPGILGEEEDFSQYFPDDEEGAQALASITDAIVLKRQVSDVADDLPERTDINIPIEMVETEAQEYERIRQEVIDTYGRAGQLVAVGQLSLFTAHPWLRVRDRQDPNWENHVEMLQDPAYPLVSPKVEVCMNLLREAFFHGRKVLIFATYNHCREILVRAVRKCGVPDAYWNSINGSTPQELRQEIVDEFSNHQGAAVLVLNPKAAGAGLNITAATIVIHFTQNWNPALEKQASARAHRRGQKNPVTIYKLYYQDTVEETMVNRSSWRAELGEIAVPSSSRNQTDLFNALNLSPRNSQ